MPSKTKSSQNNFAAAKNANATKISDGSNTNQGKVLVNVILKDENEQVPIALQLDEEGLNLSIVREAIAVRDVSNWSFIHRNMRTSRSKEERIKVCGGDTWYMISDIITFVVNEINQDNSVTATEFELDCHSSLQKLREERAADMKHSIDGKNIIPKADESKRFLTEFKGVINAIITKQDHETVLFAEEQSKENKKQEIESKKSEIVAKKIANDLNRAALKESIAVSNRNALDYERKIKKEDEEKEQKVTEAALNVKKNKEKEIAKKMASMKESMKQDLSDNQNYRLANKASIDPIGHILIADKTNEHRTEALNRQALGAEARQYNNDHFRHDQHNVVTGALYGFVLNGPKLMSFSHRAALMYPEDAELNWQTSSIPSTSTSDYFVTEEDISTFKSISTSVSTEMAISASASGWGMSAEGGFNTSTNNSNQKNQSSAKKSKTVVKVCSIYENKYSFQVPHRLTPEVLEEARNLTQFKANDFIDTYGSHFGFGRFVVGGEFTYVYYLEMKAESDETSARSELSSCTGAHASAGGSFFGVSFAASYSEKKAESLAKAEGERNSKTQTNISEVKIWRGEWTDGSLKSGYTIVRHPDKLIPIWRLLLKERDSQLQVAGIYLLKAWLENVGQKITHKLFDDCLTDIKNIDVPQVQDVISKNIYLKDTIRSAGSLLSLIRGNGGEQLQQPIKMKWIPPKKLETPSSIAEEINFIWKIHRDDFQSCLVALIDILSDESSLFKDFLLKMKHYAPLSWSKDAVNILTELCLASGTSPAVCETDLILADLKLSVSEKEEEPITDIFLDIDRPFTLGGFTNAKKSHKVNILLDSLGYCIPAIENRNESTGVKYENFQLAREWSLPVTCPVVLLVTETFDMAEYILSILNCRSIYGHDRKSISSVLQVRHIYPDSKNDFMIFNIIGNINEFDDFLTRNSKSIILIHDFNDFSSLQEFRKIHFKQKFSLYGVEDLCAEMDKIMKNILSGEECSLIDESLNQMIFKEESSEFLQDVNPRFFRYKNSLQYLVKDLNQIDVELMEKLNLNAPLYYFKKSVTLRELKVEACKVFRHPIVQTFLEVLRLPFELDRFTNLLNFRELLLIEGLDFSDLWNDIASIYVSDCSKYTELPNLASQHLKDGYVLPFGASQSFNILMPWLNAVMDSFKLAEVTTVSFLGPETVNKSRLVNSLFGAFFKTIDTCGKGSKNDVQIRMVSYPNKNEKERYIMVMDMPSLKRPVKDYFSENFNSYFAIIPVHLTIMVGEKGGLQSFDQLYSNVCNDANFDLIKSNNTNIKVELPLLDQKLESKDSYWNIVLRLRKQLKLKLNNAIYLGGAEIFKNMMGTFRILKFHLSKYSMLNGVNQVEVCDLFREARGLTYAHLMEKLKEVKKEVDKELQRDFEKVIEEKIGKLMKQIGTDPCQHVQWSSLIEHQRIIYHFFCRMAFAVLHLEGKIPMVDKIRPEDIILENLKRVIKEDVFSLLSGNGFLKPMIGMIREMSFDKSIEDYNLPKPISDYILCSQQITSVNSFVQLLWREPEHVIINACRALAKRQVDLTDIENSAWRFKQEVMHYYQQEDVTKERTKAPNGDAKAPNEDI